MSPICPHAELAGKVAHGAALASGEWLLLLLSSVADDADHDCSVLDDMQSAGTIFAGALHVFDGFARSPEDLRRREEIEQLRADVVKALGRDGMRIVFDRIEAKIVRKPIDITPDAEPEGLHQ